VRRCGLDLDSRPRVLIGAAFLDDRGVRRRGGALGLDQNEPAGLLAELELTVEGRKAGHVLDHVLVAKCLERGTVRRVERGQPVRELARGGLLCHRR
jgi:hypothetical protein